MKRIWKRILAAVLAVVLICPASLAVLPAREAAAEETMAQLKAGSGNANGHFGSATPEAFVLSDQNSYTDEDFEFRFIQASTRKNTRFRYVVKYVNDSEWGYLAYDDTGKEDTHGEER